MKHPLILLGLILLLVSCRTMVPVDPMTGVPSEKCLPHPMLAGDQAKCCK